MAKGFGITVLLIRVNRRAPIENLSLFLIYSLLMSAFANP